MIDKSFYAGDDFGIFGKVRKLAHTGEHAIGGRRIIGDAGAMDEAIFIELITVAHIEHVGMMDALIFHHPIVETTADGSHASVIEQGHRARRACDDVRFFKAGLHRVGHAGTRDDVMREIVPMLDEAASDYGGV